VADAVRPPRQGLLLVRDNKSVAVAAVSRVVDTRVWVTELAAVAASISDRFARPEAAEHAVDLVAGLISDLERKSCWTIAERAGHPSPHGLQHLLARAVCDTDGVRDDLQGLMIELGNHAQVILERRVHSSIRTTMDAYGSVLEDVDNEVIDGLDGLLVRPGQESRGLSAVSTSGAAGRPGTLDAPDQEERQWS
jgi:hypothetical protein